MKSKNSSSSLTRKIVFAKRLLYHLRSKSSKSNKIFKSKNLKVLYKFFKKRWIAKD